MRMLARTGALLAGSLLLLLAVACGGDEEASPTPTETATETPTSAQTATPPETATPTPTMTETPTETPAGSPTPDAAGQGTALGRQTGGATCDALYPEGLEVGQEVEDVFICIAEPEPGATVDGEITVRGYQAGSFEQNVIVELRDGQGGVLRQVPTTANAPDLGLIVGEWSVTLTLDAPPPSGAGSIAAFTGSARDGSLDFGGEIPVEFP